MSPYQNQAARSGRTIWRWRLPMSQLPRLALLQQHHCLQILPAHAKRQQFVSRKLCPRKASLCRPCHRLLSRNLQAASGVWKHRLGAGGLFMNFARTSALKPLPLTGVGGTTSGCCLPIALRAMPHALTKRIGAIALALAGRAMSGFHGAP